MDVEHETVHYCGQSVALTNMSEAYEQICIVPEHVHKTAFATVLGMFRSQVMQMGDCNAPSTFQRLMTAIFRDCISRFVHVYLDDIFIYSHSIFY